MRRHCKRKILTCFLWYNIFAGYCFRTPFNYDYGTNPMNTKKFEVTLISKLYAVNAGLLKVSPFNKLVAAANAY